MSTILIDFDTIVRNKNLQNLEQRIKPVPAPGYSTGLVLNISSSEKDALEQIPKGPGRVQYINTPSFVNAIKGFAYVIYDKRKKVCEITGIKGIILYDILDTTLASIPNDVTLWVGIDIKHELFSSIVHNYIKSDFQDPYICKTSPLGYKFEYYGLCMLKKNDKQEYNALHEVEYVLSQFINNKTGNCAIKLRFNPKTIEYLQKMCQMGSTINGNGTITQKELAGTFKVTNVEKDLAYILSIDRETTFSGDEEGVEIAKCLYNFHTHPREAYENHGTHLGWPSAQDYIGFLGSVLSYRTIIHVVVAMEGMYVLSLTKDWVKKLDQIENKTVQDFIKKEYNLCNQKDKGVEWYIQKVNSIGYKGFPLFHTVYLPWSRANRTIAVVYSKTGVNCFSNQETIDKYKDLYE